MIEEQKQIEERLYTIKLKVHPETNFTSVYDEKAIKELTVRKDQQLKEVVQQVRKEFSLPDDSPFMLRTFDNKLKVKLSIHDNVESPLHKLQIHSHIHLIIESPS
jgi:hypothetical protein